MATAVSTPTFDESKLNAFMGQAVQDMGAALHAALVIVGDKLGLYKAMAAAGPLTSAAVAAKAGTDERYTREWLNANAASGYLTYDATTKTYTLPPEQALALAQDDSPAFIPGAFQIIGALMRDEPKITAAFRTGDGVGWHEHDPQMFEGTERFFRPNYAANLISNWLPSLTGVVAKLEKGARVADIGCGHGSSTILMAKAYPNSTFYGFDYHPASIDWARKAAKQAGVGDRITFEVASAKEFPGKDYDLVTFFDCLHDIGDPVGASAHVLSTLTPGVSWMIVEPFANDNVEDNLNPVGRVFYSASTMICTPASRSQEVGLALGAQAGEARMRDVVKSGGFAQFRRAAQTPFNLIFEARR